MNNTKKIIISSMLSILVFGGVYADENDAMEIKYIRQLPEYPDIYNVYLKNQPTTLGDIKMTINDLNFPNIKQKLNGDYLEISNYLKTSGKIVLEKLKNEYKNGGIVTTSLGKTTPIEIRNLDETYFLGTYSTPTILGNTAYVLDLNKKITKEDTLNKKYELEINGQSFALSYYADALADGKYYVSDDKVRFLSKNILTSQANITLKIDGLPSNHFSLNKENLKLSQVKSVDISQGISSKELRLHIPKDEQITSLERYDILLNGSVYDKKNATLSNGEIILKLDISSKVDDVFEIQLRSNYDLSFTNKIHFYASEYTMPSITKLDFGKDHMEKTYFDFTIFGPAFFGDAQNFEIVINGSGYTSTGTKQYIKNTDGSIRKNASGEDMYDVVRKIDMVKDKEKMSFEFYLADLAQNNTLQIINNNNQKSSHVVSFSKDLKKIDYHYNSGTTLKNPTVEFTQGAGIKKDFDFLLTPLENFKLGTFVLKDLGTTDYYKWSFDIEVNGTQNPLSNIKIGDEYFIGEKTSSGLVYHYKKTGYSKDFAQKDIVFQLNQLFNTSSNLKMNISHIELDVLGTNSLWKNIYRDTSNKPITLAYSYHMTGCFDGSNDYCDALKLGGDPRLSFELAFGDIKNIGEVSPQTPTTTPSVSNDTSTATLPVKDTAKVAKKASYTKQMILAKNKLLKSSYKKYVPQLDGMVSKLSPKKSQAILDKIGKMNKDKLGNKRDLFDYIEALVGIQLNK